eukprot:jgi/Chlat1/3942/Chrsp26S04034
MPWLADLPSYNPSNFSQLKHAADLHSQPSQAAPFTYLATHTTAPPPDQVIRTEANNILLRHFCQLAEQKSIKLKRQAASDPAVDRKYPKRTCTRGSNGAPGAAC